MKRKPPLPQTPEQYTKLQRRAGLQIGDRVLITRTAKNEEMGWGTGWDIAMDTTVGELAKIIDIDPQYGPLLDTSAGEWYYPYFILERQ